MGVDKETKPNSVSILIENNEKYKKFLLEAANKNGLNADEVKFYEANLENHQFEADEFYYDESNNYIKFSGTINNKHGSTYIYLTIPLSDIVLIDIITAGVKKLNKLKNALESLK